jgi:HEAT repeat protein
MFTGLHDTLGRAQPQLVRLLDDPDELVRQSAAYALGALDCHTAVPKLIAMATRPVHVTGGGRSSGAWGEAYPYDGCAAVDALGQLGDLRAVRPLIFLIETQGPDGPLYCEAVRALGLLGDARGSGAVHAAFEEGRSEGEHCEALAALEGRAALDDLLELAESDEVHVRRAVCADLVRLGSPAATEAVAALLVDPDEGVRSTTREALAWTVDDETVGELVAGLESPSPDARAWARQLLPVLCAWSD